ncbi:hypothetical protein GCK72_005138 [Caenorhabditis remanei]|uniref:F-box domain-containing protein n=1 Tax=Caenorhabditis remanei TaxID=31234 RepID=A0A6A5HEE9_CAERE|nr:hypothetical protein GCK72_005138 [Caenorhabditis remanei]KAF1765186.1 hypothetical protein GCK72_005138 [Caenorhabditis remanei]
MSRNRCRCARLPVLRIPATDEDLPQLPDEIVELIVSKVLPTEIVAYGWDQVSRSFGTFVHRHLCSKTYFCAHHDPLWDLYKTTRNTYDLEKFDKLLVLLIKKYLCQVEDIVLPVALFSHIQHLLEQNSYLAATSGTACSFRHPQPGVAFSNLSKLTIQIGGECGGLTLSHNFENLKTSSSLCKTLHEINLDIVLSDNEDVTCAGFREFLRFLKEISCVSTLWNIRLTDNTTSGQGWSGPANLNRYRNKMFICYIRTMLDLSLQINQLELVDKRKASPYMLVMAHGRRTIYMFPEFKRCRSLVICYDIGLIAPVFSHENDHFDDLLHFEVDESHVLYKADLLEYLKSAHELREVKVVIPSTFHSRVSRCTEGCFSNPDFACFRADGWCSVPAKLPGAHFEIVSNDARSPIMA